MPTTAESPQLNILHVLTLNGRNGEYGGPVRVARELCQELNSRGHKTHIFSGALLGSEPKAYSGLSESFVYVKPLIQELKISSLWSWKLPKKLFKLIRGSDIIHIHFARDLVSFIAALICILNRKNFITQTHGMIVADSRLSTKLIDYLATRRILKFADKVLVLTNIEQAKLQEIGIAKNARVLPNGISIPERDLKQSCNPQKRIIFCSRIEKRKKISTFIEIANRSNDINLVFEVYGPDGGELDLLKSEILKKRTSDLIYFGAIAPESVSNVLLSADILVLPSDNEPFPMVILEGLAVGTPVVVNKTCGIWEKIFVIDPLFVVEADDIANLENNIRLILEKYNNVQMRKKLIELTRILFSIEAVCDMYLKLIGSSSYE